MCDHQLMLLVPLAVQKTLETHWGKHHKAYVTNLNKQIEGTDLDSKDIVGIVNASWNGGKPTPAFNNAAQTWSTSRDPLASTEFPFKHFRATKYDILLCAVQTTRSSFWE